MTEKDDMTTDSPKSPVDVLAEALPDALNTTEDLPEDCTPEQVFRAAAEALFPTVRMLLEDEITSRYHPEFGTEYQEQEAPGSEEAAARPDLDLDEVADVLGAKSRSGARGFSPEEAADMAARTTVADMSLLLDGSLTLDDFRQPPDDQVVDISVLRRIDKYTIEMFGHRVRATPEQEAQLRGMTPEQALRFIGIMGGGKR